MGKLSLVFKNFVRLKGGVQDQGEGDLLQIYQLTTRGGRCSNTGYLATWKSEF